MSTQMAGRVAEPRIVNPDPRYPKARLIEPTTLGYVYLAAAVQPGRLPFVLPSSRRARLVKKLKRLARAVEQIDDVVKVTVFRAIVMPPTARMSAYLKEERPSLRVPSFDVIVLIQTTSPATARAVQSHPAYLALETTTREDAESMFRMAARNVKRIADVDTTRRNGLYLFNHFAADNREVMLELWDYLAGWYVAETGLKNSVALGPLEGDESDYVIVNWARWDEHPLRHFWRQLAKRGFWRYVPTNLEANHAVSMPIYCRRA